MPADSCAYYVKNGTAIERTRVDKTKKGWVDVNVKESNRSENEIENEAREEAKVNAALVVPIGQPRSAIFQVQR